MNSNTYSQTLESHRGNYSGKNDYAGQTPNLSARINLMYPVGFESQLRARLLKSYELQRYSPEN